jgi:polyphosphate kinase
LTNEVARVFNYLETVKVPAQEFKHLLVGQFNLRRDLNSLIDQEIANAKAKKEAKIILKMNSLQDQEMIAKLYEASQAGVKIQLIVRGIMCLVPQLKGYSENIEAISIVDRYLEHARVFIFHNDGKEQIYFSSADWMVRNLSHRIETAFPIYDEKIKQEIKELIDLQLQDNVKARILDGEHKNEYKKSGSDLAIQSQIETYYYFKRKTE